MREAISIHLGQAGVQVGACQVKSAGMSPNLAPAARGYHPQPTCLLPLDWPVSVEACGDRTCSWIC
jgi:hypothetical protein